jgi:hypothetical protein
VGAGAQVTRGGPGAAPSREAGAGATGERGGPGAAPSQEARIEAAGTRGSHGAASGQEPEPWRHVAALELPGGESRCLHLKLLREDPMVPTKSMLAEGIKCAEKAARSYFSWLKYKANETNIQWS